MVDILPASHPSVRDARRCLKAIRERQGIASRVVSTRELLQLFANFLKEPEESTHRRLRLSNPKIAHLMSSHGVELFMHKTGWRPSVNQKGVWVLAEDALPLLRAVCLVLSALVDKDEVAPPGAVLADDPYYDRPAPSHGGFALGACKAGAGNLPRALWAPNRLVANLDARLEREHHERRVYAATPWVNAGASVSPLARARKAREAQAAARSASKAPGCGAEQRHAAQHSGGDASNALPGQKAATGGRPEAQANSGRTDERSPASARCSHTQRKAVSRGAALVIRAQPTRAARKRLDIADALQAREGHLLKNERILSVMHERDRNAKAALAQELDGGGMHVQTIHDRVRRPIWNSRSRDPRDWRGGLPSA